uniref:U4/U6.U5 small nuclear ribonucleoprotein 27 kDa protein n=1 Tax=Setaria digitata TaxID=48799 RepID=A0A915PLZ7_9BILA
MVRERSRSRAIASDGVLSKICTFNPFLILSLERERDRRRRSRSRSVGRTRAVDKDRLRRRSQERRRSRSPLDRRRSRSRSRERLDERRRYDNEERSRRDREREKQAKDVGVDSLKGLDKDMLKLMGFAGFDTTKNKKVPGNVDGAVSINKPRRYRQCKFSDSTRSIKAYFKLQSPALQKYRDNVSSALEFATKWWCGLFVRFSYLFLPGKEERKKDEAEIEGVELWFLSRFLISDAYESFCKEFDVLERISNAWLSTIHDHHHALTFIQHQTSTSKFRTLKINAQRIERDDGKRYVACEGPNSLTVYDFWTLVWQENVKTIMSMNFPYEERLYPHTYQKNDETIQYWPTVNGETYNFMPFKITCINSYLMVDYGVPADDDNNLYVYRLTQLRIRHCNPINPEIDRTLTHVCYFRWPDGRVPQPCGKQTTLAQAANTLLQILLMVSDDIILVHCHAGRGRTGVLIALDFALYQLKNLQTVNVEGVIEKIRQQRPGAVMNRWQYAYINVVIAEEAYRMGFLMNRIDGRHITRQLISKLWTSLENDMERNFR